MDSTKAMAAAALRKTEHPLGAFSRLVQELDYRNYTKLITEFNSNIWKTKKESGLPLTSHIQIEIPKSLSLFEPDLRVMHRI